MKELCRADMNAASKRAAMYSIRLLALGEGYAVETKRGSGGRVAGREIYWRPSAEEAQVLYDSIIRKKTAIKRSRVYIIAAGVEAQPSLF